jgi:hypothetical protein
MLLGSFLDLDMGTLYVQKDAAGQISMLSGSVSGLPLFVSLTPSTLVGRDQRHAYGYTSWDMETAKENFGPSYRPSSLEEDPSFMAAFGVFFTAVTGQLVSKL